jgi:serine/threonine-protein kinase ULK4
MFTAAGVLDDEMASAAVVEDGSAIDGSAPPNTADGPAQDQQHSTSLSSSSSNSSGLSATPVAQQANVSAAAPAGAGGQGAGAIAHLKGSSKAGVLSSASDRQPAPSGVILGAAGGPMPVGHDSKVPASVSAGQSRPWSLMAGRSGSDPALSIMWHPSDSAVKPIVANRRIERLPEVQWDASSLPFEPYTLQQMLECDQQQLEVFLTDIYRTIASAAPVKDKVNALSYFESLCSDTPAANVLINSSLTLLFVRMLRNSKTPLLRIRLASVLGLLVRHATYISEDLASTHLVEVLTEALQDRNERVRRRWVGTGIMGGWGLELIAVQYSVWMQDEWLWP